MDRRHFLRAGAGVALAPAIWACGEVSNDMIQAGARYEMPLESEPHERTLMQWPVNLDIYDRASLRRVQRAIARIANTIARHEPVAMLVANADAASARALLDGEVELWDIPTDDLWCRDSGPTFVRDASGKLAVAHIRFNGWGNKQPHANDG